MKWLLFYFLAHLLAACIAIFLRTYVNNQSFDWTIESITCEAREIVLSMLIPPLSLGWLPYLPPEKQEDDSPPIILIPGYSLNRLSLWALQRYLKTCGYHNILAINNPVLKDDIHEFARYLSKAIDDFSWRNQNKPVTLIAHSMGGIISKTYIEKYGSEKITAVVTIGTPWKGTLNHRIGIGRHVHQMSPESEFCKTSRPIPVPHLSLWSSRDWVVIPSENSIHEEHNMHKITHSGHFGMLFSLDVFRIIHSFIDKIHVTQRK